MVPSRDAAGPDPETRARRFRLSAVRSEAAGVVTLALVGALGLASLSTGLGLLDDDLYYALQVGGTSWWEVASLAAGPLPFQAALWKLAPHLQPEAPYQVAHGLAAILHGLNAILVWRLLRGILPGAWPCLAAGLFLIYRPGNESVLRAAALSEASLLLFSLLGLLAWRQRRTAPALGALAVACCAGAMLAKPSAFTLPVLLGAHVLWLEGDATLATRLRRSAAPLCAAALVCAALALNAITRLGTWSYEMSGNDSLVDAAGRVGLSLFRVFGLVYPPTPWGPTPTGLAVLGAAGALFLAVRHPAARFGAVAAIAFLPGSLLVEAQNHPRYEYPAAFGVLLVAGVLFEQLRLRGGPLAMAAIAGLGLWTAADLALYRTDVAQLRALGHANAEMRALLRRYREPLLEGGQLVVAGQPHQFRVHAAHAFRYDSGADLDVEEAPHCPESGATPCLRWTLAQAPRLRCDAPCVVLRLPGSLPAVSSSGEPDPHGPREARLPPQGG